MKPTKALTVRAVGFSRPTVYELNDSPTVGISAT